MGDTGLDRIDNKLLRNILSNCIRLRPEVADHHYRLGALLCLMNNESGAFAALSQGQALDDLSDWSDRQWIAHMAEAFLSLTFDRGDSEKAKAITYLARGLLLGGDEARESLSRQLRDDKKFAVWREGSDDPDKWWDTADRLLDRLVHPVPAQSRTADSLNGKPP
ncbi:MAG TPA: hypothetical protein VKI44_27020 [Acetobacteraceae bacterium]|nr:hypothetical protein [Acetobacteraceae bacterium]